MIDFAKITKTFDGLDCYYIGQRKSVGKTIHRFAIVNDTAELICYYDEQGKRIEFCGSDGWMVNKHGHQIIAPPKIVEVTRWVGLSKHSDFSGDGYLVAAFNETPDRDESIIAWTKHTFRFEVPNGRERS